MKGQRYGKCFNGALGFCEGQIEKAEFLESDARVWQAWQDKCRSIL